MAIETKDLSVDEAFASGGSPSGGRKRWPIAVAVVVVASLVGIGGYLLVTRGAETGNANPALSTVATFSGTGDRTTASFEVGPGWQIHWQSEGRKFAFAITGDQDFGTVVNQRNPGSGVTSPVGSGSFRIEVTAVGAWSIEILEPSK